MERKKWGSTRGMSVTKNHSYIVHQEPEFLDSECESLKECSEIIGVSPAMIHYYLTKKDGVFPNGTKITKNDHKYAGKKNDIEFRANTMEELATLMDEPPANLRYIASVKRRNEKNEKINLSKDGSISSQAI